MYHQTIERTRAKLIERYRHLPAQRPNRPGQQTKMPPEGTHEFIQVQNMKKCAHGYYTANVKDNDGIE